MLLLSVDLPNAVCGSKFTKHWGIIWGNRVNPSDRFVSHLSTLDLAQRFQYVRFICPHLKT